MRRLARAAMLAALGALLATAADAAGQTPQPRQGDTGSTDTRALAEMLFFTARGLMEAGRYPEACAKLTESYRLDPAAGTLLNLAVCNEKIGKIASAWGEFHDSIAEARKANRADREQLATERLKVIEPELPFLTIKVSPDVRAITGLQITRNGLPLQAAAWDTELPVDPGRVEVIEEAPGYKPKTLYVTIANKQHATLAAEPLELAPVVRPAPPFWTTKREIGAIVFGVGLVAAGVGTYFGVQAINDKKSSDSGCPNDSIGVQHCTSAGVSSMNNAITEAWVADIAIGVGAAAGLVGAFLFATGGAHESPAPAGTLGKGWSWQLSVGPRNTGGIFTKSF